MKSILPYLLLALSLSFVKCNAQQSLPFDKTKVVKASELNFAFSDKRGIEANNEMTYVVEQNLRILTAYKNGVQKWKSDVIAQCGEPKVGKAEIRFIKLEGEKINVVFGKHSFADVFVATGKIECLGSD
jgi:hypothetical protein